MKNLSNKFNEMEQGKKNNQLAMILISSVCLVITIATLVLYFTSQRQMIGLVKVVDTRSAQVLNSDVERREALLKTTIQGHINRTITYANSFSRSTIKPNQKKTLFLMDRDDAFSIFGRYKKEQCYEDALQRGHIYKVSKINITHLDLDNGEPYRLKLQALLTVKDGVRNENWLIEGQGKITYHDPVYPHNEVGLWLSDYTQIYKKIQNDE